MQNLLLCLSELYFQIYFIKKRSFCLTLYLFPERLTPRRPPPQKRLPASERGACLWPRPQPAAAQHGVFHGKMDTTREHAVINPVGFDSYTFPYHRGV